MTPLLEVCGVSTGYGQSQVLFDMHLAVGEGQCVSLQGRNGMGKSTTVKAIMGLLPLWQGDILWRGKSISGLAPHQIAQLGIGLTPEGRQVFPNLSVTENLIATARPSTPGSRVTRTEGSQGWTLDRVFDFFPSLAARRRNFGNQLSGGEQQMLAISRALMTNPTLLILDEATEGLSPLIRQEIWKALDTLRAEGMSILVIDKNIGPLLRLCDWHTIVEKGHRVWEGDSSGLAADQALHRRYLGA
jgi:branched-chain amino acid transport system ATP-binding protein